MGIMPPQVIRKQIHMMSLLHDFTLFVGASEEQRHRFAEWTFKKHQEGQVPCDEGESCTATVEDYEEAILANVFEAVVFAQEQIEALRQLERQSIHQIGDLN